MRQLIRRLRMPPDCREVAEVLQSYLDGELPESKTHLVAEHLEHCQRCGIEAEVYQAVKRSLQQLATPPDRRVIQRLQSYADGIVAGDEAS